MTDLFPNEDDSPLPDNALDVLVGDGKKFKDPESLAKGKLESDRFIERLQSELKETRDELQKRLSAAEVAEQIKKQIGERPATNSENNQNPGERDDDVSTLSPEDVEQVVEKKINLHQQKQTQDANIQYARTELEKAWGPNYAARLRTIVTALGVGEEFANGLAATHPKAFLKMVLEQKSPGGADIAPPSSNFRTNPTSTRRVYKDYDKLRRENPKEYFTAKVQNEMYQTLSEMGEDFYK